MIPNQWGVRGKCESDFFRRKAGTTSAYQQPLIFKGQPHKIVKHTETIRRLLPRNCLSVFDHFVVLALKGFSSPKQQLTGYFMILFVQNLT